MRNEIESICKYHSGDGLFFLSAGKQKCASCGAENLTELQEKQSVAAGMGQFKCLGVDGCDGNILAAVHGQFPLIGRLHKHGGAVFGGTLDQTVVHLLTLAADLQTGKNDQTVGIGGQTAVGQTITGASAQCHRAFCIPMGDSFPVLTVGAVIQTELYTLHGSTLGIHLPDGNVKLVYEDYFLVEASTYGDGITGDNFLHNVYGISGIPIVITRKERVVVTGEVFIRPSDFEELKQTTFGGDGRTYPNVGSFAAGALSLPDTERCRERRLCFLTLRVLEGVGEFPYESQRLAKLPEYGFDVCKHFVGNRLLTRKDVERGIKQLETYAEANDIPFGGIVATYNDAVYARSCKWAALHYEEAQPKVDPMVLNGFLHFAGKDAMNITELSKGILEQLIYRGLLQSYADIYSLNQHRDTIISIDGFSEAVWQKLWDSILRSHNTTFAQFLFAMNIPEIDHAACKTLALRYHGDPDAFTDAVDDMFDFRRLPGFGDAQHNSIYEWFWNEENYCMWFELRELFTIRQNKSTTQAA